jgi:hypothetical protein
MSTNFTITISGIRTANVGELADVIRKVEFIVKGTRDGQSFELPQSADLPDATSESFKPLTAVTESDVIAWIESSFDTDKMNSVKAHIDYVLDKEVAKAALESKPLPWAPVPESTPGETA